MVNARRFVHLFSCTFALLSASLYTTRAINHIDYVNGIGNRNTFAQNDGGALHVIVEVDGFVEFYVDWY